MIFEMMSVPLDCGIFRRIMMQFNLSAFDRKLRAIGHGFNLDNLFPHLYMYLLSGEFAPFCSS